MACIKMHTGICQNKMTLTIDLFNISPNNWSENKLTPRKEHEDNLFYSILYRPESASVLRVFKPRCQILQS